jgi:hypothetical protein
MTTIGTAVLQIIPSLLGVTEAIESQVAGKVITAKVEPKVDAAAAEEAGKQVRATVEKQTTDVKVAPKVDAPAAEAAGKQTRDVVEKHTKAVKVEPKVDTAAAEVAGKATGDAVAKGVGGSSEAIKQAVTGTLAGYGSDIGRSIGERLSQQIPTGMTGVAERINTALANVLPSLGAAAGSMVGAAVGITLSDAFTEGRLQKAGESLSRGLASAATKAGDAAGGIASSIGNKLTEQFSKSDRLTAAGQALSRGLSAAATKTGAGLGTTAAVTGSMAGGLGAASGGLSGGAAKLTETIGGVSAALATTKELLGEDSWAAPGLDTLNNTLGKAGPLIEAMGAASTLAATGAQAMSLASKAASVAQWLWNAALTANPIGLIVAAIAALVAGLVLFFTKTELGRKIWAGFVEHLKVAWEAIKPIIGAVWEWISNTVIPGLKAAWEAIGQGALWLWNNAIKPAWEGIKTGISVAWEVIKVVFEAWKLQWKLVGEGAMWLWNNAIKPAWDGIKAAFSAAWDFMSGVFEKIKAGFKAVADFIKTVFNGVKDVVKGIFNGILDVIKAPLHELGKLLQGLPKVHVPGTDINIDVSGFGDKLAGLATGGFTGNLPFDQIAGVVHGGEYVIQATSRQRIENAYPGLLDYLNNIGKLPGYEGGGLVTGAQELRRIIMERFGISNIGGYRPGGDGYDEHVTGRALDVMVGSDKAKGDAVKDFALANASAIDLKWAIWRQHLYYPGGGGYDMNDRGNPTANHMDHVHIFSGMGIVNGLRGTLKGSSPEQPAGTAAQAPKSVTTPAAASPAGSSGVSIPSSFSGLSTFGLSNLGVKTKATPDSPERTFDFGKAATAAVGGQVSSALGVFGVPDSPGWLQGISKFVGGISVGGPPGGAAAGGATPISATTSGVTTAPAVASVAGGVKRTGPTFNTTIQARDAEGALEAWRRQQNLITSSKLDSN